jgi:hypothetical protein
MHGWLFPGSNGYLPDFCISESLVIVMLAQCALISVEMDTGYAATFKGCVEIHP